MAHLEVFMATVAPCGAILEEGKPQGTVHYSNQGTGPTLVFLSHCRAFVPVDQPEVFAQRIAEFVHAEVLA